MTSEDKGTDFRHPELWDTPDRIRNELAKTMGHIYRHGMTTLSGGNLSVIDGLGNIWITPSGTDKGSMKPDDLVCVAPDGTVEGLHKPSMEYPLHREVYKARPDIRALIHAHPPVLTSFSIVHRVPDTSVVRSWREICGSAGYAGYETPGSDGMGKTVASEFMKGHDTVIMENHAVVAGGKDLAEALARLEALEYCARTIHAAGFIGELKISDEIHEDNSEILSGYTALQGSGDLQSVLHGAAPGIDEEPLAEEICGLTVRACNRGLLYGFSGTVSARSTGNNFLITQDKVLRCYIGKENITRADGTGLSLNARMHADIYNRLSSVNAVITAQPPYLMAFAVTGKEIDVRTIPESWLLLREMPLVSVAAVAPENEEIFAKLAAGSPAVLISNDSVLVTGESLLQAFDRLEVAEMTARSLIVGQSLGTVKPISSQDISELRKAFGIAE
ncbi:MAG: class II aldolase/adducin family protein [Bacteroidales bacterium]|nr:class II aldolase/adducin family protein [Bacteroidales bacterium]